MNNIKITKDLESTFVDLKVITETNNKFVAANHCAASFDQNSNSLVIYLEKDRELIYEEIIDIAENVININKFDLNINVDELEKTFKSWTLFLIDRLFYQTYNDYSLKTLGISDKVITYNFVADKLNEEVNNLYKINLARGYAAELQDTPPNIMTAKKFSEVISKRLSKYDNLKIKIVEKQEIEKLGMGLLLAVNAASVNDPYVVTVEYIGDSSSSEKTAIVGKGITFDSGGYSLKGWKGMQMMKFDMSGAAIACMSMEMLAQTKPKCNVIAVGVMTDNLIGGNGTVEDSVIKSMNGLTVEIENTDCEGRLVLADGVTYAIREAKASRIITIATLTGNAQRALGTEFSAGFTTDQNWYDEFIKATEKSFERIWQMPLTRINTKNQQHSRIADIWNEAPSGNGGASNGAGFIQQFIEGKPYLHFDISGAAGGTQRHGTGIILSTFSHYFSDKK